MSWPPKDAKVCYPECRNPWFNECADCWRIYKDEHIPPIVPFPRASPRASGDLFAIPEGEEKLLVEDDSSS